ncbi:MAG: alanine--tRNA ligase [Firmicutes bacterium]|nr:alanine--tRNA ligase [Bacillota bacterium]
MRRKFLQFFAERGHQVVPSSPLVPAGDPTLLFTNAGMVQFKDVFLGTDQRSYKRATSAQKCMRAGGKHNDLEQVGRTARHLTFFEMLGNFSFGDYFKREAIGFAWEFLTRELGIDPAVLWVTVHESDDEAARLWVEVAGIDPARIVRLGDADNFWQMGDTGPCGPSSEIYVDRGPEHACGPECGLGFCDCDRYEEIWNLVFMQYDRDLSGRLTPLPRPSIDTGMGLERVAAFLQGVESNFDTDLLAPLVRQVGRLSGRPYDPGPAGLPFRVIADHVRALTFLLAEGVSFSNEGRGYVMRRILRRALRYGFLLGLDEPFLGELVDTVGETMGEAYPEVVRYRDAVKAALRREEERFLATLAQGMRVLDEKLAGLQPGQVLDGREAFMLHDTYGFPLDLTVDAARERGIGVDADGFAAAMEEQRQRARAGRAVLAERLPAPGPTRFVGYGSLSAGPVPVGALYIDDDPVERLEMGQGGLVWLPESPFYPEGGGQVGDKGRLVGPHGVFRVTDTRRQGEVIWHIGEMESGWLEAGEAVHAEVDAGLRAGAMRNHTATHLLHAALREVLGPEVRQAGSLVAPDRLRFDFTLDRPLTEAERLAVEDLVNRWILEDRPVQVEERAREEALAAGALAFFGEKYGERVRMVTVPGASRELCGGTHCRSTGEIGSFLLLEDVSVGSGARRLEAVTGWGALAQTREWRNRLMEAAGLLKTAPAEVPARIRALQADLREKDRRLTARAEREAAQAVEALLRQAETVQGFRVLVARLEGLGAAEDLRRYLDLVKGRVDVAVLAADLGGRAGLVAYAGPGPRAAGLRADGVIRRLAPLIEGGGGGRPDVAQAGGRRPEGLPAVLDESRRLLQEMLVSTG